MIKNKVISFDLDGTLTDSCFVDSVWHDAIPRLYSIKNKVALDDAKEAVIREYNKIGRDRLEWYDLNYWIRHFDFGTSWKNLFNQYQNRIKIYPDVVESLEVLTQKGSRLVITTNASTEFLEFQLAKTNIESYFEACFSATSDFGLVKKTTRVYQEVCSKLDISPGELIHIGDDRQFDFEVPRRLGISAFHLDRSGANKGEYVIHNLRDLNQKLVKPTF